MFPLPTSVPSAGITRFTFCVLMPSGATWASVLRFWIDVSCPVCAPDKADIADSFDPRLKPASLVCANLIGPVMVGFAALPASARSVVSVPPLSDEPEGRITRSEEHTSELQSRLHLVCRLLLEKKKKRQYTQHTLS